MISYVEGKIKLRGNKFLTIIANGLGYKVHAFPDTFKKSKGFFGTGKWVKRRAVSPDFLNVSGRACTL